MEITGSNGIGNKLTIGSGFVMKTIELLHCNLLWISDAQFRWSIFNKILLSYR